jgi:hypothetical protein
VRKSSRLLEASSSRLPTPPASLDPSLASNVRFFSPLPTMEVELPHEGFDISWQRRGEEIGEYNGDF